MAIKILTDSANDVPKEYAEKYDIDVVSLHIYDGKNEYKDGVEITSKEVYENMEKGAVYKTSQVSVEDFYENFKTNIEKGNEVIYVGFSSGLSGTYNSADQALKKLKETVSDPKIYLFDTRCGSGGAGLIVLRCAMMVKDGKSVEEILKALEFYRDNQDHVITIDDMVYLYRGGRISKGTQILGGLLNIKPILEVTKPEGKLQSLDKARGDKQLYKRVFELMRERSCDGKFNAEQTVGIFHGNDPSRADMVAELMEKELGVKNFLKASVGGTIGCHTGPGVIVICFLRELYEDYNIIEEL